MYVDSATDMRAALRGDAVETDRVIETCGGFVAAARGTRPAASSWQRACDSALASAGRDAGRASARTSITPDGAYG